MKHRITGILISLFFCIVTVAGLTACSPIFASERSLAGVWKTEISIDEAVADIFGGIYKADDDTLENSVSISMTFEEQGTGTIKIDMSALSSVLEKLIDDGGIGLPGIDVSYIIGSLTNYIFKQVPDDAGEFQFTYEANRKMDDIKIYAGDMEIASLEMTPDGKIVVNKGFTGEGLVFVKAVEE